MKSKISLLFVLSFFFLLTAFSKSVKKEAVSFFNTQLETVCDIDGFVTEQDPKGLNVRESPSQKSKILGVIPPALFEKNESGLKYLVKPELKIIGSQHGWIKIKNAQESGIFEELTGIKPRKMFTGTGWVSGKMLTIKSQAKKAYSEPSITSRVVHSESPDLNFDKIDSYQLLACQDRWVYVIDKDLKKQNRYWLNKTCGFQETTCDGLNTD